MHWLPPGGLSSCAGRTCELLRQVPVWPWAILKLKEGGREVFPPSDALEQQFLAALNGGLRQTVGSWIVQAGGFQLDVILLVEFEKLLAPELRSAVRPDHRWEPEEFPPAGQRPNDVGSGGGGEALHKGVAGVAVHHDEVVPAPGMERLSSFVISLLHNSTTSYI